MPIVLKVDILDVTITIEQFTRTLYYSNLNFMVFLCCTSKNIKGYYNHSEVYILIFRSSKNKIDLELIVEYVISLQQLWYIIS